MIIMRSLLLIQIIIIIIIIIKIIITISTIIKKEQAQDKTNENGKAKKATNHNRFINDEIKKRNFLRESGKVLFEEKATKSVTMRMRQWNNV